MTQQHQLLAPFTHLLRERSKPLKPSSARSKIASKVRLHGRLDTVNPHLIEIGEARAEYNCQVITHCPARVKIGQYVFVGYGPIILPNIVIGDYALIGAGSVVTKDVEPYQIVAGNPDKPIGIRPQFSVDEQIQGIKEGRNIGEI